MIETTKQLKYQQAHDHLMQMLKTYNINDKLPSERKLAEELGCTVFTVRNALDHMEQNGIITRRHGSGTFLRSKISNKKNKSIALLIPPNSGAYGQSILEALFEVAREKKLELRTIWIKDFKSDALIQAKKLKDAGFNSLVLPWIPAHEEQYIAAFIEKVEMPVTTSVIIHRHEEAYFELPQILGLDVIQVIEGLINYFVMIGKTNIAILEPEMPSNIFLQNRFNAYSRALAAHNLEAICDVTDNTVSSVDRIIRKLKKYSGNLGIICYDDTQALRILTSMHKNNLKAPDDFSVIGFNNIEQCIYSDPPLTTISQDFQHLAKAMLEHTIGAIDNKLVQNPFVNQHSLIIRESCGGKNLISKNIVEKYKINGLNIILE
ncbi:MAG: GntR family transcriptional regulator [Kiritimatiellae bacterium]|jgi:DNA-binding LacI/PurR family transcriptional regulator|nr:GntR family transcriptional regulator [Kiritimatiellia bacterium]